MRDDGDFLKDLRQEISSGKEHRFKYVSQKLLFIVGLFGLGLFKSIGIIENNSSSLENSSGEFLLILYVVPLVVIIYDLYIIGEDFGIKRAGRFIAGSPEAPPEEKRWEAVASANRDPVSGFASIISSLVAILGAAWALWASEKDKEFFKAWSIACVLVVGFLGIYKYRLLRALGKLNASLSLDGVDDFSSVELTEIEEHDSEIEGHDSAEKKE